MTTNPLHILVTRPEPQGVQLTEIFQKQGDTATYIPTIAFADVEDKKSLQKSLAELPEQDWLIFISPQAVHAAMKHIKTFPEGVGCAAVGEGTAKALAQYDVRGVIYPEKVFNSEALLALTPMRYVLDNKIMIVRGEAGRELLGETLARRGAIVSDFIIYKRVLPEVDVKATLSALKDQPLDVIICTSFEGVENLATLVGEEGWPLIENVPLVVMSERIKRLSYALGFQTVWVSRYASNDALLAFINEKRDALCQKYPEKK